MLTKNLTLSFLAGRKIFRGAVNTIRIDRMRSQFSVESVRNHADRINGTRGRKKNWLAATACAYWRPVVVSGVISDGTKPRAYGGADACCARSRDNTAASRHVKTLKKKLTLTVDLLRLQGIIRLDFGTLNAVTVLKLKPIETRVETIGQQPPVLPTFTTASVGQRLASDGATASKKKVFRSST